MPQVTKLLPLSHEHHDVLAFARQLRSAAAAHANANASAPAATKTRGPRAATTPFRRVLQYLEHDLPAHLAGEERIIAPFAVGEDGVSDDDVTRMVTEHMLIRAFTTRLRRAVDNKDTDAAAAVAEDLGSLLEQHVVFEERTLFPRLQEEVGPAHDVNLRLLPRIVHPHSLENPLVVPQPPSPLESSWSRGGASDQINCTSVQLAHGRRITWHCNPERDIALVVTTGELTVTIADDAPDRAGHKPHVHIITAGATIIVTSGSWRELHASGPHGATWVSIHAARPALDIT